MILSMLVLKSGIGAFRLALKTLKKLTALWFDISKVRSISSILQLTALYDDPTLFA